MRDVLSDDSEFRKWLARNTSLSSRSIGDTASRARRAGRLVNLTSRKPDAQLLDELSQISDFKELTSSVRSQLRKSVMLFRQFHSKQRI